MIPDKIYLPMYPNYDIEGEHLGDDWSYEPEFTDNVTYIRKSVLLGWVRELNETYQKEYELSRYTSGEHWGQMVAFQKVIDKLNEM